MDLSDGSPPTWVPRPRACRECAKAKAKCSLDGNTEPGTVCDRCDRLKKACVLQQAAPRPRKRNNRVAQLERKLDDIATRLGPHGDTAETPSGDESTQSLLKTTPLSSAPTESRQSTIELSVPPHHGSVSQSASYQGSEGNDIDLWPDLNDLLQHYRQNMMPYFPFVLTPEGDASTLKQTHPFLFTAVILAAVNKDVDRAAALRDEAMRYVSEHIVLLAERNLDLLQGLLVWLGWYHYHFHHVAIETMLEQLSFVLLADLGLNKAPKLQDKFEEEVKTGKAAGLDVPTRTLDESRAFLGCFYLSSEVEQFRKRLDPLRSTTYLDECCYALEQANVAASDRYLVHLVRLEEIRQRTTWGFPLSPLPGYATSIGTFAKATQNALLELKRFAPAVFATQAALNMHYFNAEIELYECAFHIPRSAAQFDQDVENQRVRLMANCLSSVKAFFGIWFSLPPTAYFDVSYPSQLHLGQAIITLYKLSTYKHPNWDLEEVRGVLDLGSVVEDLEASAERAKVAVGGAVSDQHVYLRTSPPWILFKKHLWEQRKRQAEEDARSQTFDPMELPPLSNAEMDSILAGFDFVAWDDMIAQWSPGMQSTTT